jgi:hypothetical protein
MGVCCSQGGKKEKITTLNGMKSIHSIQERFPMALPGESYKVAAWYAALL